MLGMYSFRMIQHTLLEDDVYLLFFKKYFKIHSIYLQFTLKKHIQHYTNGSTRIKNLNCLRWFGHLPLESIQSVQHVNLYAAYRAQAFAWGAFFVKVRIDRKDRTDTIALLRFCETIARNSTKMTIFGSILRFSGKTRTVTP